jgi:hypothetical protein
MPPRYPDVNGIRTSYASIELGVDGQIIKGVTSINYRETHEIGKGRGTASRPQWRTRGELDFEGDIEILQADWLHYLLPKITRGNVFGFGELAWTVKVVYAEISSPTDIVTDRLDGVRFTAPEVNATPGVDAITVKLTLSIMDIIWANKYRSLRTR